MQTLLTPQKVSGTPKIISQFAEMRLKRIFEEDMRSENPVILRINDAVIKKISRFLSGEMKRSCAIGIAGETASGKSTITLDIIDTINAFIVEFKSLSEMKLQAFKENLNHGIRLSDIDVAINLYDFYLDSIKTDSLLNIKKLVTNLGLKERRGRLLFEFAVIHKEILEEIPNEITNISFYEDYFSLLKKNNEIIGSISEEFKLKFKSFYNRYKNLPKSELRLAISDFAEGKDYYEEKEKQQKIIEEMEKQDLEAKKDSVEVISSDDLIDRNANANLNYENPIIKEIVERKEEENNYDSEINNIDNQNDLYEEKKVNDKNKYVSLDKSVKEIKDILSNIKLLCIKNKAIITKENKNDINEIMDNLDELMRDYSME